MLGWTLKRGRRERVHAELIDWIGEKKAIRLIIEIAITV